MQQSLEPCTGCGALVPRIDGPTHRYIGASPGCWAIYGEVLAREYGEYGYPAVHRLTVDAYAAQHPGTPSPQSIKSVAVHLMALYLTLERGYDAARTTAVLRQATAWSQEFIWLDPPGSRGALTILDVHGGRSLDEHTERVEQWAKSVWDAWSPHHQTVRRWADGIGSSDAAQPQARRRGGSSTPRRAADTPR